MAFAPKLGCPMCGVVSSASNTTGHTLYSAPSSESPEILWRDDNFTVYRERENPVSSKGHIIIVFNLHIPSLYTLSSSDLPLLVSIRGLADRLLSSIHEPRASYPTSSSPPLTTPSSSRSPTIRERAPFRIGFITPPFRDFKISAPDHLHVHAYVLPADRMGWFRSIAFCSLTWYAIDDLIAEIREESSNNRIRSGTSARPIDSVPQAGTRRGTADGIETTDRSLAVLDLENGGHSPRFASSTRTSSVCQSGLDSERPAISQQ